MRKKTVCLLVCIMGVMCIACTKGSSVSSNNGEITVSVDAETSKWQNIETEPSTEALQETKTEVPEETMAELNTVESLENDGKEMSAAEAIRSVMKGKRSALELMFDERLYKRYGGGWPNSEDSIKDMPDTGLARINMLTYNRQLDTAITPIKEAKWKSFVCVDLDQDGTKEAFVEGGPGVVALHYNGGEVYMTVINVRGFPDKVYENGICYRGEGSAWSHQYDRYYPAKGEMYRANLTDSEEGRNENGSMDYYKIYDKEVTKEEYDAYIEELIGGLTPIEWHEFNEENIDKYVVD